MTLAYLNLYVLAGFSQLVNFSVPVFQNQPVQIGLKLDLLLYSLLLLDVPSLLSCDPELHCNVVSEVQLLFFGKIVGPLQMLDGFVQTVAFQQSFAWKIESI